MKAIFKNLLVSLALLMIGAASAYAQPTLKGKVTDASGQPLPGVAVMVSGTSNGTMTDENGNYIDFSAVENVNEEEKKKDKAALADETPLGRLGTPQEVARLALYLAKDTFITGEVINIGGGFLQ